ncbi:MULTISPECIES: DUF421 domain-containing protein [unclassified Bacillus (in: firmicutes)]|uniref:DUF421 domain-containing protein n=1 Tax=unclassified Bacillus (in: firmicutes) TaxID=185979 RepID=UPI0008F0691D|nr:MULTISPECIES: DUF421 domain-containing protein [unclassified Bacillus (in: firmicutes)]PGZ93018.1 DUF421 domain-containing protein [Bacillus sp. AFS029533]SFD38808.1 Uncharacterized membrane protein YcaP, DUF421 family [Bacillus sp. UNCCL81]
MIGTVEVIIRTLTAFVLLICITHLLGKQTISKMTYHDYITSITLGSIAGNLTFNTAINFRNYITALIIFSTFLFLATLVSLKNKKARAIFNGEPTVVIQDGKILEKNIEKLKVTMDSFNQALRRRDIFDIDEVEFAVFEPDGHLSILKKPIHRFVTRKDMGISNPSQSDFPIEIIMDGQFINKNITQNHLTKEWIITEIDQRGLNLSDVSYCVRGTNGQLYFDLYKDQINSPVDIES